MERTIIGLIGPEDVLQVTPLEVFPGVERVIPVLAPYRLVSREFKKEDSVVPINDEIKIGGKRIHVIAGPCSIETAEEHSRSRAQGQKSRGHHFCGRGVQAADFPYDFQGLGEEGLKYLAEAGRESGMATVTEVMDPRDLGAHLLTRTSCRSARGTCRIFLY